MEKPRASDMIEMKIIKGIMNDTFIIGASLPSERELAEIYGVGRPTVREALQRLERDGWITFQKGNPAIINDYWKQGNLMTIVNLVCQMEEIPPSFIVHLLELRMSLAPAYVLDAIQCNHLKVVSHLAKMEAIKDEAVSYAQFDWELQKSIAGMSSNPIYLLILNSFNDFYVRMATKYFERFEFRQASREYYRKLTILALNQDEEEAYRTVKEMMSKSIRLWNERNSFK